MIPWGEKRSGMRRALFGSLLLLAFLVDNCVVVAHAGPASDPDNMRAAPANEKSIRRPVTGKQIARAKPKHAPLSFQAAESAAARPIEMPATTSRAPAPAGMSWTGFHVGVGGGLAN